MCISARTYLPDTWHACLRSRRARARYLNGGGLRLLLQAVCILGCTQLPVGQTIICLRPYVRAFRARPRGICTSVLMDTALSARERLLRSTN